MPAETHHEFRDDVRRTVRLFRGFLTEQSDPDGFYSLIAEDTVALIEQHVALGGLLVADLGGGPGYYTRAFRAAGARPVLVDADLRELTTQGPADRAAVLGRAQRIPLATESVDVAFSSNLLEHVAEPSQVCNEIARVVRPGGLVVVSYTIWLSPWGGHETSPWHYLGGRWAARRYERKHGHPPKNLVGENMFATSAATGLRWAQSRPDLEILEQRPRYLPPAARVVLKVPALREVVTWNLWQVFRKRGRSAVV